ncbi:hypothetical protein F4777DRAFT_565042 [Nemania sp. FL0916]|nr:hypothetical protein F4777DRAFT_565042 [Nemania sp. FL0916]
MPLMAGVLGLSLGLDLDLSLGFGLGDGLNGNGLWEPFAAPLAAFVDNWFALRYLLPLISFVCVGLEGWCFFDLTRKTLGARSARAIADARDAATDYDVVKDFPRGGFEPSNNQLCVHGLLGIKLHARHTACPSNPVMTGQGAKGQTMPCGCLLISRGRPYARRRRRREMSYIAI